LENRAGFKEGKNVEVLLGPLQESVSYIQKPGLGNAGKVVWVSSGEIEISPDKVGGVAPREVSKRNMDLTDTFRTLRREESEFAQQRINCS
jgi:F0F1-type ATP synthase epsilon subunit